MENFVANDFLCQSSQKCVPEGARRAMVGFQAAGGGGAFLYLNITSAFEHLTCPPIKQVCSLRGWLPGWLKGFGKGPLDPCGSHREHRCSLGTLVARIRGEKSRETQEHQCGQGARPWACTGGGNTQLDHKAVF